jgi:hypothetical protein
LVRRSDQANSMVKRTEGFCPGDFIRPITLDRSRWRAGDSGPDNRGLQWFRAARPCSATHDRRRHAPPPGVVVVSVHERSGARSRGENIELLDRVARLRNVWFGDGDEVVCHDLPLSCDDPIIVPAGVESHLRSPRESHSHPPGLHLQAAPESRTGCPASLDS